MGSNGTKIKAVQVNPDEAKAKILKELTDQLTQNDREKNKLHAKIVIAKKKLQYAIK